MIAVVCSYTTNSADAVNITRGSVTDTLYIKQKCGYCFKL